jgi:hypothetical protein
MGQGQIPAPQIPNSMIGRLTNRMRRTLNAALPSINGGATFGGPSGVSLIPDTSPAALGSFVGTVVATPSSGGFTAAPTGCYYIQPQTPQLDMTNLGSGNTNGFTLVTNSYGTAIFGGQPILAANVAEVEAGGAGGTGPFNAIGNELAVGTAVVVWAAAGLIKTAAGTVAGVTYLCMAQDTEIWALVTGTLTMGGAYTGHLCAPLCLNVTSSAASVNTGSLFTINTQSTVTLINVAEAATTWHFIGSNTYVMATASAGIDTNNGPMGTGAPILLFDIPMPVELDCVCAHIGGSNGTIVSSQATFASLTYTGSYNGQTLFSAMTLSWGSTQAGSLIPATVCTAKLIGIGANAMYIPTTGNEKLGGPQCGT